MIRLFTVLILSAGITLSYSPVTRADAATDLVKKLVEKGILSVEEGEILLNKRAGEIQKTEQAMADIEQVVVSAEKRPVQLTKVDVGKKGLMTGSPEDDFSFQVGGRMHADSFNHFGDGALAGTEATGGTEIRRARMYFKGKAWDDFKYMVEADFAGNKVSVKDLFLTYRGFDAPVEVTFGNQKHAFSMEVQESSNDIMFTERSLVYALAVPYFDRAIGLNLKTYGNNWNIQGGIYGDTVTSASKNVDEGLGFGVRGTYAPIMDLESGRVLHLGANYGYRELSDDALANTKSPAFAYETTNGSDLKLLNTGDIAGLESVESVLLELSAMYGPLSFQSEFARTWADLSTGPNADFTAFYTQVGYTLTGESRTYKGSDGEFKRLKPAENFNLANGSWGGWELALRYDQLDLEDGLIAGGEGKRISMALNWYLNANVRLMADWSRTFDLDNAPIVNSDGSSADDIDVVTVRAQWAF